MKNKNWGLWTLDFGHWTKVCGLRNMDSRLLTMDCGLWTFNSRTHYPRLTTQNSRLTIYYLLFTIILTSCNRPITNSDGSMGLPILLAKPSYPIDIFFANQTFERNYESLGAVKVEKEVMLSTKQTTKQGRMVNRGNNEEQKRALLDQLILQGLGLGANAIINVNYKYYTAATYQGFSMEGVAIKYKKEGE